MAIENIKDLENLLKLEEGTLKSAIESSDNVKIEVPELVVRKKEEEVAFVSNLKTQHFEAAQDIFIKNRKKEMGLEFEGKDPDKFIDAIKKKALEDAKINPDKQIVELRTDLEKVQNSYKNLVAEHEQVKTTFKQKEQARTIDTILSSEINVETSIPKEDVLTIFKSKYVTELDDSGKVIIKKDGEVLKSSVTAAPLTPKEVMSSFISTYSKTPTGGSGGKDEPGGSKPSGLDMFTKEMQDKGINPGSEKYNLEMQTRIKNKTLSL